MIPNMSNKPTNREMVTAILAVSPDPVDDVIALIDKVAKDITVETGYLRCRVAELEATLANERGEGEPPCEGWEWDTLDFHWEFRAPKGGFYVEREDNGWTWDADHINSGRPLFATARDAMRKASEMVKQ